MKNFFLLAILALLTSCAGHHTKVLNSELEKSRHEEIKLDVPFVAQKEKHCGPTSLYTILKEKDPTIQYQTLVDMTFSPGAEGAYKNDMLAAVRRLGYAPYPIPLQQIPTAIGARQPVLVFQNLALSWYPLWHYSVIVGYSKPKQAFFVHDGKEAYKETSTKRLAKTWERGGKWSYVIMSPQEIPPFASHEQALQNAMIFERLNLFKQAKQAYQEISRRWPRNYESYIGLATLAYRDQEYQKAIIFTKKAINLSADNPYLFLNLAQFYQQINQDELASRAQEKAKALMLIDKTASQHWAQHK